LVGLRLAKAGFILPCDIFKKYGVISIMGHLRPQSFAPPSALASPCASTMQSSYYQVHIGDTLVQRYFLVGYGI
jgi:hypothetical protein